MSTATETVAGRFGAYGGRYVPETLMAALEELEHALSCAGCGARYPVDAGVPDFFASAGLS